MSTRPRAQDAETILSVVVGYSLDEAGQHFPGVRLRTHADHLISGIACGGVYSGPESSVEFD
jgi:hypothetical protein